MITANQMRAAQESYDYRAAPQGDVCTIEAATEYATDELMATGYSIAFALGEHGCEGEAVITDDDVLEDEAYHPIGRPLHELLAVMMSGTDRGAMSALRELRERMPLLMYRDIADRANELMLTQCEAVPA